MRIDLYLVQNQTFDSRNKAAVAVKDGCFTVNGRVVTKPSFEVSDQDQILAVKAASTYVSRSAHKLLHAFEAFPLDCKDAIAIDLGASTGGFCQVLLEKGVQKVYAVDIGTAQLHPSLGQDPRIVNMEHTNARHISPDLFEEPISFLTGDLSFISLKLILLPAYQTLAPQGNAVFLVKPQFEAGPAHLSKSGVVIDRKIHTSVLEDVAQLAQKIGFSVRGVAFSGLAGESGNREYLLYLQKSECPSIDYTALIKKAVYLEDSNA